MSLRELLLEDEENIYDKNINDLHIENKKIKNKTLQDITFSNVEIIESEFNNVFFENVTFDKCDLSNTKFIDCGFKTTQNGAKLTSISDVMGLFNNSYTAKYAMS